MKNSFIYMRSINVSDVKNAHCSENMEKMIARVHSSGRIAICQAKVTSAINYSALNFSFAVNEL